jgi:hypothetical protein
MWESFRPTINEAVSHITIKQELSDIIANMKAQVIEAMDEAVGPEDAGHIEKLADIYIAALSKNVVALRDYAKRGYTFVMFPGIMGDLDNESNRDADISISIYDGPELITTLGVEDYSY